MTMTAVSRCSECRAVTNIHWPACLVCQAILPTVSEVPTATEATPDLCRATEALHLEPGLPVDLLEGNPVRIQEKKLDSVHPVLRAGDTVEWLSPALPRQGGEVLAVHPDATFEVFHPLTEAPCRLPVSWVTKVVKTLEAPSSSEPTS